MSIWNTMIDGISMGVIKAWQRFDILYLVISIASACLTVILTFILLDSTKNQDFFFTFLLLLPFQIFMMYLVCFSANSYYLCRNKTIRSVISSPFAVINEIERALNYYQIVYEKEKLSTVVPWSWTRKLVTFHLFPYDVRITVIRGGFGAITWVGLDPTTVSNQEYLDYMKELIDCALNEGVKREWKRLDRIQLGMMALLFLLLILNQNPSSSSVDPLMLSPLIFWLIIAYEIILGMVFFRMRGNVVKLFSWDPVTITSTLNDIFSTNYPNLRRTIFEGRSRGMPISYVEIFKDDVTGLQVRIREKSMYGTLIEVGPEGRGKKDLLKWITRSIDYALLPKLEKPPIPLTVYSPLIHQIRQELRGKMK